MADALLLQDWTTVTCPMALSGTVFGYVVQNETDWRELPGYQDVALYVEISQNTLPASVTLQLQTSPTKDENFFSASTSSNAYMSSFAGSTPGVQSIDVVRWSTFVNMPLSRYLRWRLQNTSMTTTGTVSFRIWLSLNQAGSR